MTGPAARLVCGGAKGSPAEVCLLLLFILTGTRAGVVAGEFGAVPGFDWVTPLLCISIR